MGFLKVILIVLLIYFGGKIILRLLAPFLLKYVSKKMERKFGEAFGQFQQQTRSNTQTNSTGETVIDKQPPIKRSSKKVGEYIDFEEID